MSKAYKKSYFDEKFDDTTIPINFLPLFHSCDALTFKTILQDKELEPTDCTVFEKEKVLYLFYGRPAYKSSSNYSSGLHSLLPTALILKIDSIESIRRIAPFDTGAFKLGLYKDYMHPDMEMYNFFLTPSKTAISKTVNYFFDNNDRYFSGKPKQDIKFDVMDFDIESYYNLIKGVEQGKLDDRKASIEIQLDESIKLSSNSLEAVIIPEDFLASKVIQDIIIKDLGAEVITYESYGIPSNNYYAQVLGLTKEYLIKKSYLNATKRSV